MSHLKFEEALHIAYFYSNKYSGTVASPTSHYGQPHQLALPHLAELMAESTVLTQQALEHLLFCIRALEGILYQLDKKGCIKLITRLSHDMHASSRGNSSTEGKKKSLLNLKPALCRLAWDLTDRTSSAAAKGRKLDQRSIVPETLLHKTTTILCGTEPPLTITKERIPSTSIV